MPITILDKYCVFYFIFEALYLGKKYIDYCPNRLQTTPLFFYCFTSFSIFVCALFCFGLIAIEV